MNQEGQESSLGVAFHEEGFQLFPVDESNDTVSFQHY
jgi:hypothetical protein